jgi:hypothetical protein
LTATQEQIREFGLDGISKYQRFTIDVDTSSTDLDRLSKNSVPEFREEEAILKVLIEGSISLFYYSDGDRTFYYSRTTTGSIDQLIYKQYMIDDKVGTSNFFRAQLRSLLKCDRLPPSQFNQLAYTQSALIRLFEKYYSCRREKYTNYEDANRREAFHLTIRPGVNISSLGVQSENNPLRNTEFPTEVTYRLGLEAEYVFPFRNNQWSILIEPSYQYYQSDKQTQLGYATVDFAAIDLSIGVRYSILSGEQSTVFFNGHSTFSHVFDSHSKIMYENDFQAFTFRALNRLSAGLGYRYLGRYNVELRYHLRQNILIDYIGFDSQYRMISFILGYTF